MTGVMKKEQKGGFSLMELLVIIVIIGILVGLLFPVLMAARESAKRTKAGAEVRELERACMMYRQAYGVFPTFNGDEVDADAVDVLSGEGGGIKFMDFKKGAFDDGFLDPWGRLYRVQFDNDVTVNTRWRYRRRVRCANAKAYRY